jgi:hypothetical protein
LEIVITKPNNSSSNENHNHEHFRDEQGTEMNLEFLRASVPNIKKFLVPLLLDGGGKFYSLSGTVSPKRFVDGMSGFEYYEEDTHGEILIGFILGGGGFAMKRVVHDGEKYLLRYDYFDQQGDLTFTSDHEALKTVIVDFFEMDITCPVLNHFYNFLSLEYRNAKEGKSQTDLVHSVESFLCEIYKNKALPLAVKKTDQDPAILKIYSKIMKTEMDPVLNWEERQIVFKNLKQELEILTNTKIRAHRLSKLIFNLKIFQKNFGNFFTRLISRPWDNFNGLLYRYTVGKFIWFINTVKNNLGYSVALAIYGPFTYYFITMPMNPHAMQAVGRVRSSYLDVRTEISRFLNSTQKAQAAGEVTPSGLQMDKVRTTSASSLSVGITTSRVTEGNTPLMIQLGDGSQHQLKSALLGMPVGSDLTQVNDLTWTERMGQFKQMQIAFEENIEFASRMGRLEQLETQYNFPLQVESTWEELERYNNAIFKIREQNPNLSPKLKQYLVNEINRTQQLELYLWDRMGRFIQDQIYVMLDQDKEQKRNDYYVGRAFIFMEEMTSILSWRYQDLKKPSGYEKIKSLSDFYKLNRQEFGSVLKNLTANSELFRQKNLFDTKEMRSYMKRQWEILYLQNAKAEEASNMGLNMYIWSVRNTIWVLQSLYSAKREELGLLIKQETTGKMLDPTETLNRSKISLMYENLIHNLVLEYVGIRDEIMNRLGKDIESTQRMVVIENLKEFLSDREKLDKQMVATSETNGKKI